MVEHWREGYHVAYGIRTDRDGETAFKLATAKGFYRVMNRLSETPHPAGYRRLPLDGSQSGAGAQAMPERDRFVRGMVSWLGFGKIAVLIVVRHAWPDKASTRSSNAPLCA